MTSKIKWIEKEIAIADLKPNPNNPRLIREEQFKKLKESIEDVGYHGRIVCDEADNILGGNMRYRALVALSVERVQIIYPDQPLTQRQKDKILVQDNLGFGEWDFGMLADMFSADDLEEWGMPREWLEGEKEKPSGEGDPADDDVPSPPPVAKTVLGDIWILGNHRVMCGDSCDFPSIEKLLSGASPDIIYTDPPYGIDEQTDRSHRGTAAKGGKFEKIIGDQTVDVGIKAFGIADKLCPIICYWGGNYFANFLPASASWIVWDKRVEENQRDTNSDCELAYVKHPTKASVRIFRHLWKGMIKGSEHGEARVHPTQKPISLAEWTINELAEKAVNVLDMFGGSGSSLIACERSGRKCFMMELSPSYVDVIVLRWQEMTGQTAHYAATGELFNAVKPSTGE